MRANFLLLRTSPIARVIYPPLLADSYTVLERGHLLAYFFCPFFLPFILTALVRSRGCQLYPPLFKSPSLHHSSSFTMLAMLPRRYYSILLLQLTALDGIRRLVGEFAFHGILIPSSRCQLPFPLDRRRYHRMFFLLMHPPPAVEHLRSYAYRSANFSLVGFFFLLAILLRSCEGQLFSSPSSTVIGSSSCLYLP